MSSSNPPNPNTPPQFNNDAFLSGENPTIDVNYLNSNYLQFPFAQGTENLGAINVAGTATHTGLTNFNAAATANANLLIGGTPAVNYIQFPDGTRQYTSATGGVGSLNDVLAIGNTATGAYATITLNNSGTGYTSNPQLILNNSNATAGNTSGVPSIELTKTGRNGAINDVVGSVFFNALDGAGVERTFGKIESTITTNTAPSNYDGALDFYSLINGVNNLVFRLNGADNENNTFRPFDLNGNALKTSTTNLTLDATASTGTGTIILTPKSGAVVDIQSNATLTGTRQAIFGGGTNITDTIDRTGLLIQNNTASPDITQSIYQDANCNLVQIQTSTNSQYFNTNTPQNQTIRRMDLTSGSDLQKNQSTLVHQRLDYTDTATSDQSTIILENDLASLNNKIEQTYTTGAGAVLINSLTCSPYGTQRLSMTNNNTGLSTTLNTAKLEINDTTNNKSITIDNNPSSIQNRIDLFKNDGGGISSQVAITDTTSSQILSLSHTDNANNKTIAFSNNRSSSTTLTFDNTIDANGFDIISNKNLNLISNDAGGTTVLQSANGVQITGQNTIALNTNTGADTISLITNNLVFTGANLQSNTSSGNSGEHLIITLNGVQYKIALENP